MPVKPELKDQHPPVGRELVARKSVLAEIVILPLPLVRAVVKLLSGPTKSTWKATIGASWLAEMVPPCWSLRPSIVMVTGVKGLPLLS